MSDQEAFIQRLAQTINQYHLSAVALFLLDLGQPIAFLGEQLLWVSQPVVSLFVSKSMVEQLAAVLEEPAAVERLTVQITHLGNQDQL
ncbi:MAG: hypothetical protein KDE51_21210 [Anaerolineales bacterium]|nr:hypothetical protein [Anaerolineales bacterium]